MRVVTESKCCLTWALIRRCWHMICIFVLSQAFGEYKHATDKMISTRKSPGVGAFCFKWKASFFWGSGEGGFFRSLLLVVFVHVVHGWGMRNCCAGMLTHVHAQTHTHTLSQWPVNTLLTYLKINELPTKNVNVTKMNLCVKCVLLGLLDWSVFVQFSFKGCQCMQLLDELLLFVKQLQ